MKSTPCSRRAFLNHTAGLAAATGVFPSVVAATACSDTVSNIDEAVRSDTLCHLSDLAMRLNRKLVWDPRQEQFLADDEANLRLRPRKMRPPWRL